jgi:hypothetical protein
MFISDKIFQINWSQTNNLLVKFKRYLNLTNKTKKLFEFSLNLNKQTELPIIGLKNKLIKIATTTTWMFFLYSLPATASSLQTGTNFSLFLECLNDGIALVNQKNPKNSQGWQYSFDSRTDGVNRGNIYQTPYDIYSMGIKETTTQLYIAINSNVPYQGHVDTGAGNGRIGLGDLFINPYANSLNLEAASTAGKLYGVRFIANNESGVSKLGVYKNVTTKSITSQNYGFARLSDYNKYVTDRGGTVSYGDLAANTTYFDSNKSTNVISSGTFMGNINLLSAQELTIAGFDWNNALGQYTIAFSLDKSLLDIPSTGADPLEVPEPNTIVSLGTNSMLIILSRRYQKS